MSEIQEPQQQQQTQELPQELQSADIEALFQERFGVPLSEAEQKYQEAQLKVLLAEAWDISPKQAMQRLQEVTEQIAKLPQEEQEKLDSVEGVVAFYEKMTSPQPQPPALKPLGVQPKAQQTPPKPTSQWTKAEIQADVAAYQAAIFEELKAEGLI